MAGYGRPLASQSYKLDQYIMREGTKTLFVFHADEIRSEDGSTSTTSATIPSLNGKNRLKPMRYLVPL